MSHGRFRIPSPKNELVLSYAPGTSERQKMHAELDRQASHVIDIPCVINGEYRYTGKITEVTMPCDHQHVLARVHCARPEDTDAAVAGAEQARRDWSEMPQEHRAAVFLKAAELLSRPWRARINAATMLGQAKTVHQAEIDAVAELADFWRFNVAFAEQLTADQPPRNSPGTWNRLDYRPLDGFVYAVSPFNFTSIAANLPTAPALLGNTAIWKPATTSALACWHLFQLLEQAGLPPGVINLLNGQGQEITERLLPRPEFGGLHFTGSTATFQTLWTSITQNLSKYRSYPRIVGETGGKDFVLAHASADPVALAVAILRGGYEYQGQKCSAASRIYVPSNLWPEVRERVVSGLGEMRQGDVRHFGNFISAVIDQRAFKKHCAYLDLAAATADVLAGGTADDSDGWYVEPTFVQVKEPTHRLMSEEIFGPIVSCYVYEETQWAETLRIVDNTSPYALTGAVFAQDRRVIVEAERELRSAAGNFYINDKPTGAVVGQQPFGGGRASGTNDKAGSVMNLMRWVNARTIKETFAPPTDWRYPFLEDEG